MSSLTHAMDDISANAQEITKIAKAKGKISLIFHLGLNTEVPGCNLGQYLLNVRYVAVNRPQSPWFRKLLV